MLRLLISVSILTAATYAVKMGYLNFDFPFLFQPNPERTTVFVSRVIDGDTIQIDNNQRVRLKGIDCPESNQYFGDVATTYLTAAIEKTQVVVENHYTDEYKRIVGVVYYGDININRFMVEQGLCWAYRRYVDDVELFALEEHAKNAGIGLWGQSDPQPPWLFRASAKKTRSHLN
jgi:micrococcal nuclease